MKINSDISKRVSIQQSTLPWIASPLAGIQIRTLERGTEEAACATVIIKCAPGSSIGSCTHALGEEIVVLDGVLTDEFGSYGK